jgi:L,D-transpeptidase catalytic domain
VIPPEQLAGALERLDPRERELLALSLRRRVPDDALARVYDVGTQEVARRRAAAIESLADELGAQRGEDLGAVLQALLDESAWRAAEPLGNGDEAEEAVAEAAEPEAGAEGAPAEAEAGPAEQAASGNGGPTEVEPEDERRAALVAVGEEAAPEAAARQAPVVPVPTEPVLEMLAAREGVRGPDAETTREGGGDRRAVVAAAVASFVAAVIGGAAVFVGLSEWGGDAAGAGRAAQPADNAGTKNFVPQLGGPFEAPFPTEPQPISCSSIAYAHGRTTLYRKPGGRARIKLGPRTEWGSPRIFGVVRRRGDWVSVQAPELDNGEVAWMPQSEARVDCVHWAMRVDRSRRRLYVQHNGKTVRRFVIAVGRKGNATPRGRFSVTDKLRVTDRGSPYGCCVLALSGHQTHLPPSWPGGDRLAIHATTELSSIGRATSLGCMRVTSSQARWLIKTIPLGTPLYVKA